MTVVAAAVGGSRRESPPATFANSVVGDLLHKQQQQGPIDVVRRPPAIDLSFLRQGGRRRTGANGKLARQ